MFFFLIHNIWKSLNHEEGKVQLLIKSGYYIVPNPSTKFVIFLLTHKVFTIYIFSWIRMRHVKINSKFMNTLSDKVLPRCLLIHFTENNYFLNHFLGKHTLVYYCLFVYLFQLEASIFDYYWTFVYKFYRISVYNWIFVYHRTFV